MESALTGSLQERVHAIVCGGGPAQVVQSVVIMGRVRVMAANETRGTRPHERFQYSPITALEELACLDAPAPSLVTDSPTGVRMGIPNLLASFQSVQPDSLAFRIQYPIAPEGNKAFDHEIPLFVASFIVYSITRQEDYYYGKS